MVADRIGIGWDRCNDRGSEVKGNPMRHLLALFALSFALVACDDTATTAPTDTIPGPPDAPRLSVTVLTGTKAAPVDSPTVKVQWWYKDSVGITVATFNSNYSAGRYYGVGILKVISGDSTYKVGCESLDSLSVGVSAKSVKSSATQWDTVKVYCKAP